MKISKEARGSHETETDGRWKRERKKGMRRGRKGERETDE